jgi:hypothetical protein
MEENPNVGEAMDIADNEVRMQHGSTSPSNQPAFVRGGGPFHSWLVSVYNIMGTLFQRQLETVWKANNYYKLGRDGDIKKGMAKVPDIAKDVMTYFVVPGLIGEVITGLPTEDKRGIPRRLLAGLTQGVTETIPILRDFVHGITTGQDPGIGLASSVAHDFANVIRDISKGPGALNKQHAAKTVEDFLTMAGVVTGAVPRVVGHSARYGINVATGKEDPFQTHHDDVLPAPVGNILRGITTGTQKERVVR